MESLFKKYSDSKGSRQRKRRARHCNVRWGAAVLDTHLSFCDFLTKNLIIRSGDKICFWPSFWNVIRPLFEEFGWRQSVFEKPRLKLRFGGTLVYCTQYDEYYRKALSDSLSSITLGVGG